MGPSLLPDLAAAEGGMGEHFDPWMIWLVAGVVLIVADLALAGGASGVLLLLGLMALAGMVAALAGLEPLAQLVVAVVAGVLLLPLVLWYMRRMSGAGSGAARRDARTGEAHYRVERWGERVGIRVLGDFFPVRSEDVSQSPPEPGEVVRVVRFEGITALIQRVSTEEERAVRGDD